MALKRIGQILVDLGLIDEQQLATMLEEQSSRGGELLGGVGVSLGFYTDEQLGEALAEQWGTTFVTLYDRAIPSEVIRLISEPMAQLYRVVPLELSGNRLTIASADPQKIQIADELRTLLGYDIHVCVATEAEITKTIEKLFMSENESVESLVSDLEGDTELAAAAAAAGKEGVTDLTSVVELIRRRAADVIELCAPIHHAPRGQSASRERASYWSKSWSKASWHRRQRAPSRRDGATPSAKVD